MIRVQKVESKPLQAFHAICAGILEQYMGAWNRVGIGLSYQPARLHRLEKSIPGIDSWASQSLKV